VRQLPSGTVTLLFTDIEASTRLLDALRDRYQELLADHHRLLRRAWEAHEGIEIDTAGDAFFVAFTRAEDAVHAAADAQRALAGHAWPDGAHVRVRMGMHTGTPALAGEKYVGLDVHRAARISAAAHGGQVLLSQTTRDVLDERALADLSVRDLGEHRLKDFDEPVWLFQLGEESFPPLKTISNTNLPRPASSFVGREQEVSQIVSLLRDGARLVTLSGPGGSGKTRLAIEAAAELVPEFRNGVFWVALATLRDPELVMETVAQMLGAKDGIAEHIGERELLLMLDNFEQVVEAAPELSSLLESCPNLRLLVTSRELLRVRGEVELAVPPLGEREAVELFSKRSQLEPSDDIAELCRRLDNLPLAVELAAARSSVLSPAQILDRLARRLDLLKGGRDAEARQQTLRTTIEWSYELLTKREQQLFVALSVFAGGCTLEAAEEVASADLDTLQSLVDKSLVRHSEERFWMLETIRDYAHDRLDASGTRAGAECAHAAYFLELTERLTPLLLGPKELDAFERFAAEHDNLRAALRFFIDSGDRDRALQLASGALQRFWRVRGLLVEGRAWLEEVLSGADGDPLLRANALRALGNMAGQQGDTETMLAAARDALDIPEASRDPILTIDCCVTVGNGMTLAGEYAEARRYLERAERLSREIDDRFRLGAAIGNLGNVAMYERDYERARALARDSVQLAREIGLDEFVANSLLNEALAAFHLAEYDEAEKLLRECFEHADAASSPATTACALEALGAVASARGDADRAVTLLGAARALEEEVEFELDPVEQRMHDEALERARAALTPERFETVWNGGKSMTPNEVAALVGRTLVTAAPYGDGSV
jgi:predicted ATPase/class 3 adenylate cyclase